MNWHPKIEQLLKDKNFEQVILFYENEIETNPDDLNNYWYLGLAYLLNGNYEDCESVWLLPFLEIQDNDIETVNQKFLDILMAESERQEELNQLNISIFIRKKILEINPNLYNIFKLLLLRLTNNSFNIEMINEYNCLDIVNNHDQLSEAERNLVIKFLEKLLDIPHQLTLDFVKIIYPKLKNNSQFRELLTDKIEVMAEQKRFLIYGAKLLEITLINQPQNLEIIRQTFIYYSQARSYENAKLMAFEYLKYSSSLIEKVFASYQLLLNAIESGEWLNIQGYYLQYQENLNNLVKQQPEIKEKYLFTWLANIGQLLLYINDEPIKNRQLINGIGQLFEIQAHKYYNCPVNFSEKSKVSRKLKIGYIGHTLRSHSVGLLSRWLIQNHDRTYFSIYTYFACQQNDYITEKFFINNVDQAYNATNVVNDFITQIEKDEIDILVDLDSFTHNLTAMIMALKPAPIQVSWLGMDSNGIPNIDYFIADPYVLPDDAHKYYQEKIWRLPNTYLGINGFEIDVPNLTRKDLEIGENGIIFFNVQSALKRNPHTIHLQMKIIKAVPNSYLLIKGLGDEQITKNLFITIAEQERVDRTRLRFLERSPTEAIHRANLQIADVVLDTYPYNGATTTLETLWMEIPLVTRVGEQFAARNSYTFMMNAGITEGIAWSDEEYIEWGIKLGTDENLRKKVRWKLRQSKKTSPLWNGKQFAREMEKAYQQMWKIYVSQQIKQPDGGNK
ncbi:O-linked N-acetylglucosamine transferase, SPINDLY family protein [Cyanobacterium aponinum UTEX 3221]|uniref:O-linked N-acetylglucosamine transferase, SPINDLY family protein n=1 Tax=Cyanobacterium aponinum TaxID=379064 RepID=UPI002B4BFE25|nr:O-linked N-acetylglucosamine transferase, SPINDLY family protein [Cyanobacterium aponinum]WRL37715.1 O-linked N-acetylglucosamine transferase, SPINDLY family protein [Cyanobacterium aponinum UTEX 3221]